MSDARPSSWAFDAEVADPLRGWEEEGEGLLPPHPRAEHKARMGQVRKVRFVRMGSP
jgi:hypothetical protein